MAMEITGMINIIKQPMPRQISCGPCDLGVGGLREEDEYLPIGCLLIFYFACIFNCFYDLVIAGASAEVPGHSLFDLIMCGIGFFFQ